MKQKFFLYSLLLVLFLNFLAAGAADENDEMEFLLGKLEQAQNDTARINVLLKLGEKSSWSDLKSSEQYSRQALQLAQKVNYTRGLAFAKYQLPNVFIDFDLELAEELILESLEHAKAINDSILIARTYNVIGNLKDLMDEKNDALTFYNKSLQIYKRFNQDSLAAGIYNNLGIVYNTLSVDSLSEVYYLKAAEINLRTENFLWLAINYLNLGESEIDGPDSQKGMAYLEKSLEIAQSHDFKRLLPWIYNNMSNYYVIKKEYVTASRYAGMALEVAKAHSNLLQEQAALTHLKDISVARNAFRNAFRYAEELSVVNDSINRNNKLSQLDMLEMRLKFEEERKQQLLEKELLKAELERKELTLVLILLGAGLLIITFIFLYVAQRNRVYRKNLEQKATLLEKENLSKELEFKNKELTTNVMYLLKKNEFISKISDRLKNTSLDLGDNSSDVVGKIISELDKSISEDSWTDFELRFQEVHVDFYNQLSKKFPDLTPNELRLCAFLRLNMTSKEISSITYQSLESLKAARYRLRKKLNLERDENLVAFLAKL